MFSANGVGTTASNLYIEDLFNVSTYSGTGTTPTSITPTPPINYNQGSFVWMKGRGGSSSLPPNTFIGNTPPNWMWLTRQDASSTSPAYVSSAANNTVTFGSGSSYVSGDEYLMYSFIYAQKFFKRFTFSGNGSTQTVAHDLGSTPGMVIVKSSNAANSWYVWHRALSFSTGVYLNSTAPAASNNLFTSAPDATNLYLSTGSNASGVTYDVYVFAHNAGGFGQDANENGITCGSYTGNGSNTTGVSINLGYEPQFVWVKNVTTSGSWVYFDTTRGANQTQSYYNLNGGSGTSSDTLSPSALLYPTSTGFTVVSDATVLLNNNAETYIYLAIRRGPMRAISFVDQVDQIFNVVTSASATGTNIATTMYPDMQISRLLSTTSSTYVVNTLVGSIETMGNPYAGSQALATDSSASYSLLAATRKWQPKSMQVPAANNVTPSVYWRFRRSPKSFTQLYYTGTSGAQNVSHDLGVAPQMIWVKKIGTQDWQVYHSVAGASNSIILNSTAAPASTNNWQSTIPTATQFTVGNVLNTLGDTYVAYLFGVNPGISSIGGYTGTGSSASVTGTRLDLDMGFPYNYTAQFVLIKRIDSAGGWYVFDTKRVTDTLSYGIWGYLQSYTYLDSTAAESSNRWIYTLDGGITLDEGFYSGGGGTSINIRGATYIYYAVAGNVKIRP